MFRDEILGGLRDQLLIGVDAAKWGLDPEDNYFVAGRNNTDITNLKQHYIGGPSLDELKMERV